MLVYFLHKGKNNMKNFDVDLAIRLASDSKKVEESDSMVRYARKTGVVKKKSSPKCSSRGTRSIKID